VKLAQVLVQVNKLHTISRYLIKANSETTGPNSVDVFKKMGILDQIIARSDEQNPVIPLFKYVFNSYQLTQRAHRTWYG
jgi:hypothetical protein